jgi:Ca2+-binding RTX toxin-like protein
MASWFSMKTSINGKFFNLAGTSEGSVSMSSKFTGYDLTITLNSKKPLEAVVTGDRDATVIGSKSADTLDFSGALGNYKINTRDGDDTVIDGKGNNTFDVSAGNDTLVFKPDFGNDKVIGFDTDASGGQDLLDIRALGITDFDTQVDITDAGADTLVTIGTETILLVGIADPNTVTESSFVVT